MQQTVNTRSILTLCFTEHKRVKYTITISPWYRKQLWLSLGLWRMINWNRPNTCHLNYSTFRKLHRGIWQTLKSVFHGSLVMDFIISLVTVWRSSRCVKTWDSKCWVASVVTVQCVSHARLNTALLGILAAECKLKFGGGVLWKRKPHVFSHSKTHKKVVWKRIDIESAHMHVQCKIKAIQI